MNWITEPKLVSAISEAGGLGILAIAHNTPEESRKQIREIRELTDKPFGVNQPLRYPVAPENIRVALEERVPVINYSLGRPWFIDTAHEYGGKVVGTVATVRHAVYAEQLGVDAIIATGNEAAGHGSDCSSLVLIPIVAERVNVPLIAAGGFYNGRGLASALLLGADAISMGTRFMITRESILHERFKQFCLRATERDTLWSNVFDGMPGRVLKTPASEGLLKERFALIKAISGALEVKRMLKLSLWQFIQASWRMSKAEDRLSLLQQARLAAQATRSRKALSGDEEEGVLFAGQCCGGIHDIPGCQELIERIVSEAEDQLKRTIKKTYL
jgi:enoyl-[acyl-carrier protein] reductase II